MWRKGNKLHQNFGTSVHLQLKQAQQTRRLKSTNLILSSATCQIKHVFGTHKFITVFTHTPPFSSALCQVNQFYTITLCVFKIHFNIIVSYTPTSSERLLSFGLSDRQFIHISFLPHACCMHMLHSAELVSIIFDEDLFRSHRLPTWPCGALTGHSTATCR